MRKEQLKVVCYEICSLQWRVFHRSKVSIAYPAFMRKERKEKMNALFLYSNNNNYCTTVMPYFGIPEYYIKFSTTQQSYPPHTACLADVSQHWPSRFIHPQPSSPRSQPMVVELLPLPAQTNTRSVC